MSRFGWSLVVAAVLVTVSVFSSAVTSDDVRPVAAWLSAAWLVAGLVALLAAFRRRLADVRRRQHAAAVVGRSAAGSGRPVGPIRRRRSPVR